MIALAGHEWDKATAVVVCSHVYAGSEVRTVHVDDDGTLCFQCGRADDDPKLAKILCLEEAIERPGLHDVPNIPIDWIAHREINGGWSIETQSEQD